MNPPKRLTDVTVSPAAARVARRPVRRKRDVKAFDVEGLADMLTPSQVPAPAMLLQARRSAAQREALLAEFGGYSAAEVAEITGSTARNRSAFAGRLAAAGKLVGVGVGGRTVYPAFQLDGDGQPRAVVSDVLAALPDGVSAWYQALWWTSRNPYLADRRPVDLLDTNEEPDLPAAAAKLGEPLAL